MSSREQSPEIVIRDENSAVSTPENKQRLVNATAVTKSTESSAARPERTSAIRHIDAENGSMNAKDTSTPNGIPARTSAFNASVKSDTSNPLPTISQLRPSGSQNRLSGSTSANGTTAAAPTTATTSEARTSTTSTASPTQSRLSGAPRANAPSAAAANSPACAATTAARRPPAVPPILLQQQQQQQRQPVPLRTPLKTPSASLPRAAASFNGSRRTCGSGKSKAFMPKVSTPAPNYNAYMPDVAKYLKEVVRRRDEAATLKLLPSAQLLEQAVLQEQAAYEQIQQQQALAFMQITHKKREAEAKMKEQQTTKAYKEKMDEQKQQHKEDMLQQKTSVAESTKEMEAEIKERLRLIVSLQPRLNIVQAVMAQIADPASDCSLLADLMQEDKQLQRVLKADARYNKSKTADVDGGAAPYWWKQCVCASFNVAAIVKQEPCRASVVDANVSTKVAADKKVVVVKDADGTVVAWAHTRIGGNTNALVEAFLAAKPEVAELPAAAYKGVLWPKDESMEVLRAAKGAKSATAAIVPEVITILSYKEVGSFELMKKDVLAAGEAAS